VGDVITYIEGVGDIGGATGAHNFPLDLAAGEVLPVAVSAPAVNG
jgi:hypothetical protein